MLPVIEAAAKGNMLVYFKPSHHSLIVVLSLYLDITEVETTFHHIYNLPGRMNNTTCHSPSTLRVMEWLLNTQPSGTHEIPRPLRALDKGKDLIPIHITQKLPFFLWDCIPSDSARGDSPVQDPDALYHQATRGADMAVENKKQWMGKSMHRQEALDETNTLKEKNSNRVETVPATNTDLDADQRAGMDLTNKYPLVGLDDRERVNDTQPDLRKTHIPVPSLIDKTQMDVLDKDSGLRDDVDDRNTNSSQNHDSYYGPQHGPSGILATNEMVVCLWKHLVSSARNDTDSTNSELWLLNKLISTRDDDLHVWCKFWEARIEEANNDQDKMLVRARFKCSLEEVARVHGE